LLKASFTPRRSVAAAAGPQSERISNSNRPGFSAAIREHFFGFVVLTPTGLAGSAGFFSRGEIRARKRLKNRKSGHLRQF
jgi:hypothetical protein